MPLRREFEEYWDDIDQNFVQEPAAGGQTWKDRAYPQAADQRKKLENSLSDIDAQMAELEAAKKAVLQAKKLSDRKKEQEAKLDKCRTEEEAAQGRVRYVSENDALSFCRGAAQAFMLPTTRSARLPQVDRFIRLNHSMGLDARMRNMEALPPTDKRRSDGV
ncbi:hypothetical protein CYMTET_14142 [Cymbomonas tetramitiformis]|uniref:Uncharacterized protein n=1 Tax=Cymbomonas tetramitiformis TaxID=36881 RepID=A0AAE0GI31_9CHLO|nr:hypothetical protein CYMTET_14142 [Cymbomonas tetramitiformis]